MPVTHSTLLGLGPGLGHAHGPYHAAQGELAQLVGVGLEAGLCQSHQVTRDVHSGLLPVQSPTQ